MATVELFGKKILMRSRATFDIISFQNVLEHVENPLEMLLKSKELLAEDGHILIFTPVSDCHAFRKYGTYWASLDIPSSFHFIDIEHAPSR